MSGSGGTLSQLEALFVQLPENDSFELDNPVWPLRVQEEILPQAPSPFEDYQQFPFHWTGESMSTAPVTQSPTTNLERAALIAQFPILDSSQLEKPQPSKNPEPDHKPGPRKRRFRQLRRAMSLTHIRHKPTPPDTAPPTPTVPNQVPSSVGVKSIESLAHWQLPDPTAAPTSLDGNLLIWPASLLRNTRPSDQLSPPSSIPSESDILPPDCLGMELDRNSRASETPSLSPRTLYPPALYDSINLNDPNTLEKGANGKVVAGTVEGVVAYITSPDCLDYDVLSDFFMMYRKFMNPSKLLGLLFARYEWGLIRGAVVRPPDNEGMVRVRTFAALRHWLLNYFADDFAPSASLRCQFIKYIKIFAKDRRVKASGRDTKIITELRRCWKKVCTLYWNERNSRTTETDDGQIPPGEPSPRNRVPSLIFRATREREERLGSATSQSSPDLRRRFLELGGMGTVNSTRPAIGRGHARIHSTSSINDRPRSQFRHKRNASDEPHILYSKNSNPTLYQSFARGDGTQEWPSVIVRNDLLVTSPKTASTRPTWRQTKRLFQNKRKAIAPPPKSPTKIACLGELSDDENNTRWTRKMIPSVSTSEPARDRVDFLAAGMWASFISAASATGESLASVPRAEELGEALVQGYIQPAKVDDVRALAMAKDLDKGKEIAVEEPPILFDMTMTSTESQGYQTTISMSEIERRLASARLTSIPPIPDSPESFRRIDPDIRFSEQRSSHTSVESPASSSIILPVQPLRRRPGGNLRNIETVGELQLRPQTMRSVRSSLSSFSFALVDDRSILDVPRISAESRSLRSLLNIPRSNRGSRTPRRTSGLALDFSRFQIPQDIESSDDENCDPEEAVQKTLLKLEGKYVSKKRRTLRSVESEDPQIDEYYEIAFDPEDLGRDSVQRPSTSGSPPASLIVEKDPDIRWARRHKHIVDGNECNTPTRRGPFTSSIFDFIESPAQTDEPSMYPDTTEEVEELAIPVPTVESALAELERDRLEEMANRPPHIAPPKPPENYHRSLAAHLPFILQYDSSVLARQFTLIEKDICAEIDWAELIEPTWMERNAELVDVRDWKGFVVRDEGDRGLDTVMARFNLMAGWTTSEIVLTQSLVERTKVVSKFIHIAEACRRIHNYATLTQIVMGLQSNHISALKKTWERLNTEDAKLWKELQNLVDSRKNWCRMRNEMDRSSAGPRTKGEGCIPFLGIFMSDLVHVAPRSPLNNKIDFEGLRQRASIVKRTLRMIELADEYDIRPEAGVGERCLWITAFDEPMLRRIAAGLESKTS